MIVGYSSVGLDKARPGFLKDKDARIIAPDLDLVVLPSLSDKAIMCQPDFAFSFGGQSFALKRGPLNAPWAGYCALLGETVENQFLVNPDSNGCNPLTGE